MLLAARPRPSPIGPRARPGAVPTTDGSTYPPSAGAPSTDGSTDPPRSRHAFALYNLARLGMLAVVFGVFYLVGLRGLGLVVAAFLVSGAVSTSSCTACGSPPA